MDERDSKQGKDPIITIVERRKQRQNELSSAELMKIIRKRSVKNTRREVATGSQETGPSKESPVFEVELTNK